MRVAADAIWSALAAAIVVVEVLAHTAHHPVARFDATVRHAGRRLGWRVAVFVGWLWLGWHLFAR
jgi:uncharacterized membrane protein (UPF0182 family)